MRLLYNLFISLYNSAIHIASVFNPKAKLWVRGRADIFNIIESQIQKSKSPIIWFHCASLGEFEQARPLIERIKTKHQSCKILLTFFSPSGYEVRKNYDSADYVFYLPMDTSANAKRFVSLVNPKMVFFIKYEFWFNYLNELKNKNIPTYLVSGIFRDNHYFFKGYGSWFRRQLNCFTHFFLQDDKSVELLKTIGYNNTTVCGDTRFDRVVEIANNAKSIALVEQFVDNKKVIIAGSTWQEDEKIIADCGLQISDYKLIIAPHQIDENHIQSILLLFKNSSVLRYSKADATTIKAANVLIIDNIGMLSSLYQYGTIAFVGGGFGNGIHNILEAATFGLPVIFGTNYHKFAEAAELIRLGGAFSIVNKEEFSQTMQLLEDKMVLQTSSYIARNYVQSKTGATQAILNFIFQ